MWCGDDLKLYGKKNYKAGVPNASPYGENKKIKKKRIKLSKCSTTYFNSILGRPQAFLKTLCSPQHRMA